MSNKGFSNSIGGSKGSRGITATSVNYSQSGISGSNYKPGTSTGKYAQKPDSKVGSAPNSPKPEGK